ncbi:hypothetical protein BDN67DRAFT_972216 [Paxillus ammoniavirescens]|nr:hypothetical protein BDN67DRAFT_972216 [Paxillus ammoniavirescens]
MPTPERSHDIYARLLIPIDSSRGYPLWYPEPDSNLPPSCRDEGLRIGDVGIVTERGIFDVLFNVCLPKDHTLNQRCGVPATFKQVQLSVEDVCKYPSADNAGRVISTKSIYERNITASVASGNSIVLPAQLGLQVNFTSTSAEGAILVLPEGAGTQDLLKLDTFEREAKANGESWYHYAYIDRGRTAINNDSLYLITGYHKASSWAIAAFSDESGSAGLNATFTAGQVIEGNVAGAYSWQVTCSIHWRVGPEHGHSTDRKNQAISIRGFKIALRESIFGLLRHTVKVSSGLPGTKSSTLRGYFPRSISPGNRIQGCEESQRQSLGGMSGNDDSQDADDSDLTGSCDASVELSPFPSASKVYHPSDMINRFLLDSEPRANVALTHDTQWMSFPGEGFPIGETELITRIQQQFYVKYDCTGSGSVHLEKRTLQASQSPKDSDVDMDLTEKDNSKGAAVALKQSDTTHHDCLAQFACGWLCRDKGEIRVCSEPLSCRTASEHFKAHGIVNMVSTMLIFCQWDGCCETIRRDNFIRHVRALHLGHTRKA